jgi:phage gp29-like protein
MATRKRKTGSATATAQAAVASLPQQGSQATIPGSVISPARIEWYKRSRFNPIKNLDPDSLTRMLDDFYGGYLREIAQLFEAIQNRDDILKNVIKKRTGAVTRLGYEVCIDKDAPEAQALLHKEALDYFYSNLEATNSVDSNQKGGFKLLVKQMMDAVAKKYAVHQILWRPDPAERQLTALFNFVPLWFFENVTGSLRFLQSDFDLYGLPLDPQNWMVTVGDGLMETCAVDYMFKKMTLADFMIYMERHGMPAIHAQTDAAQDSEAWQKMEEIVAKMSADFSCLTSKNDLINILQHTAQGQLPYPTLIERMDRMMAALWRGADLSTMSAGQGQGQGASLQEKEELNLQSDDAEFISETLQMNIDRKVIQFIFGPGVKPMAYLQIKANEQVDVDKEIKVDKHLIENGIPVAVKSTLERYQRPPAEDGEPTLQPQINPAQQQQLEIQASRFAANEAQIKKFIDASVTKGAGEQAKDLAPVMDRMRGLLELDGPAFEAGLFKLKHEWPELTKQVMSGTALQTLMENSMFAAMMNGRATEAVQTVPRRRHTTANETLFVPGLQSSLATLADIAVQQTELIKGLKDQLAANEAKPQQPIIVNLEIKPQPARARKAKATRENGHIVIQMEDAEPVVQREQIVISKE